MKDITNNNTSSLSLNINNSFIGLLVLFTAIFLLNAPVLTTLWRHGFDDGTYSHAFLIPFITLYLYYKMSNMGQLTYRKSLSPLPATFFIISSYLFVITSTAQISLGYWSTFLLLIISSVTLLFRFNWRIVFPSVFLIFAIPFWGLLTTVLQNVSVAAVTYMMSFTGVPTYVDGNLVSIPAGVFEIAGGCSGLRYIIVSLTISSLFIFLYIKNLKKAALFLFMAILGALITNWIRITALIIIGEYTNMESSLMEDHNTFGWYLYIPFMFLLFRWGNRLADFDMLSHKATSLIEKSTPTKALVILMTTVLLLSSTVLFSLYQQSNIENIEQIEVNAIKPTIFYYADKQSINLAEQITNIQPNVLTQANYVVYHFNGNDLDGKPSFYGNTLIPEGWNTKETQQTKTWQVTTLYKGASQAILLIKYEINGQSFTNIRAFKMKRLITAVQGINETKLHWAFIPCEISCEQTINSATLLLDK
jgi:exosortase A